MDGHCKSCKYWEKAQTEKALGECLRYPPVLQERIFQKKRKQGLPFVVAMWTASIVPYTADHFTCGEWKARG